MAEPENKQASGGKPWIYVLRVNLNDGTARYLVMISQGEPGWEQQLDEAEEYFSQLYGGKGYLTVHYAADPYSAGVNDVQSLVTWKEFKETHRI